MSENSTFSDAVSKGRAAFMRHPVLILLILGLVIRALIMCTAVIYDSEYWAVVIRNIETGNGLYAADGYYYTPVWGYVLGLVAAFQDAVLSLGDSAVCVFEIIPTEGTILRNTCAVATSIAFNFCTKIPLVLIDLIMAYLVYVLVKDMGGSNEKAIFAFALTWMSPVLLMSSGVVGMPDTLAATFAILSVILVRRGQSFFAGLAFALGFLTKFFPLFLVFVLLAYLISKYKGDTRRILKEVAFAATGAVLAIVVIFLPQALEGSLPLAFQFITDRIGGVDMSQTKFLIIVAVGIVAVGVLVAIVLYVSNLLEKKRLSGKGKINRKLVSGIVAVTVVLIIAIIAVLFIKIQSAGSIDVVDSAVSLLRVVVYCFVLVLSILFAKYLYRSSAEDLDRNLLKFSFLTMVSCMLYPPVTQYLCVVVPFLAYYIAMCDRKHMLSWKLVGVGSILVTFSRPTTLLPIAAWTDLIEVSSIVHLCDIFLTGSGAFILCYVIFAVGAVMQYFGILAVFWEMFGKKLVGKRFLKSADTSTTE